MPIALALLCPCRAHVKVREGQTHAIPGSVSILTKAPALLSACLRPAEEALRRREALPLGCAVRRDLQAEVGKQSKKTFLNIFGRYIEEYMTLFDTM